MSCLRECLMNKLREFAIYGTPEDVLRQRESLEDAGIQYFIVDLKSI